MVEHNPPPIADRPRAPVIPLPVALYFSDELIFELYGCGQHSRKFSIRWERFLPAREGELKAAAQNSQAVLRTHPD
jgi:hypothetical protein